MDGKELWTESNKIKRSYHWFSHLFWKWICWWIFKLLAQIVRDISALNKWPVEKKSWLEYFWTQLIWIFLERRREVTPSDFLFRVCISYLHSWRLTQINSICDWGRTSSSKCWGVSATQPMWPGHLEEQAERILLHSYIFQVFQLSWNQYASCEGQINISTHIVSQSLIQDLCATPPLPSWCLCHRPSLNTVANSLNFF